MGLPIAKGPGSASCIETDQYIGRIKEGLLKPVPSDSPCTPEPPVSGKIRHFKPEAEKNILDGKPPSSGEIPTAIADEQVYLSNLHLKEEERANVKLLLCGALDTQDAYAAVNNCLALPLLSESTDLPKLLGELNKLTLESAKEFPAIAEKIKKAYDQICVVKTAFNAMKQCIDKVCNADEKKKLADELTTLLPAIEAAVNTLVAQGDQAVMSVVQAASIFALNNVTGLENLVSGVKPAAEQFKKDIDGNVDTAAKKATDWQKKYGEAISAVAVAHGEFGKASTLKYGKEAAYCFMNQSKAQMISQKDALLEIFDPSKKNGGA